MHIGQPQQSTLRRRDSSLMIAWVWQRKRSSWLEFIFWMAFPIPNSWIKSTSGLISMPNTWTRGRNLSISQVGKTGLRMFVFFSSFLNKKNIWFADCADHTTTREWVWLWCIYMSILGSSLAGWRVFQVLPEEYAISSEKDDMGSWQCEAPWWSLLAFII